MNANFFPKPKREIKSPFQKHRKLADTNNKEAEETKKSIKDNLPDNWIYNENKAKEILDSLDNVKSRGIRVDSDQYQNPYIKKINEISRNILESIHNFQVQDQSFLLELYNLFDEDNFINSFNLESILEEAKNRLQTMISDHVNFTRNQVDLLTGLTQWINEAKLNESEIPTHKETLPNFTPEDFKSTINDYSKDHNDSLELAENIHQSLINNLSDQVNDFQSQISLKDRQLRELNQIIQNKGKLRNLHRPNKNDKKMTKLQNQIDKLQLLIEEYKQRENEYITKINSLNEQIENGKNKQNEIILENKVKSLELSLQIINQKNEENEKKYQTQIYELRNQLLNPNDEINSNIIDLIKKYENEILESKKESNESINLIRDSYDKEMKNFVESINNEDIKNAIKQSNLISESKINDIKNETEKLIKEQKQRNSNQIIEIAKHYELIIKQKDNEIEELRNSYKKEIEYKEKELKMNYQQKLNLKSFEIQEQSDHQLELIKDIMDTQFNELTKNNNNENPLKIEEILQKPILQLKEKEIENKISKKFGKILKSHKEILDDTKKWEIEKEKQFYQRKYLENVNNFRKNVVDVIQDSHSKDPNLSNEINNILQKVLSITNPENLIQTNDLNEITIPSNEVDTKLTELSNKLIFYMNENQLLKDTIEELGNISGKSAYDVLDEISAKAETLSKLQIDDDESKNKLDLYVKKSINGLSFIQPKTLFSYYANDETQNINNTQIINREIKQNLNNKTLNREINQNNNEVINSEYNQNINNNREIINRENSQNNNENNNKIIPIIKTFDDSKQRSLIIDEDIQQLKGSEINDIIDEYILSEGIMTEKEINEINHPTKQNEAENNTKELNLKKKLLQTLQKYKHLKDDLTITKQNEKINEKQHKLEIHNLQNEISKLHKNIISNTIQEVETALQLSQENKNINPKVETVKKVFDEINNYNQIQNETTKNTKNEFIENTQKMLNKEEKTIEQANQTLENAKNVLLMISNKPIITTEQMINKNDLNNVSLGVSQINKQIIQEKIEIEKLCALHKSIMNRIITIAQSSFNMCQSIKKDAIETINELNEVIDQKNIQFSEKESENRKQKMEIIELKGTKTKINENDNDNETKQIKDLTNSLITSQNENYKNQNEIQELKTYCTELENKFYIKHNIHKMSLISPFLIFSTTETLKSSNKNNPKQKSPKSKNIKVLIPKQPKKTLQLYQSYDGENIVRQLSYDTLIPLSSSPDSSLIGYVTRYIHENNTTNQKEQNNEQQQINIINAKPYEINVPIEINPINNNKTKNPGEYISSFQKRIKMLENQLHSLNNSLQNEREKSYKINQQLISCKNELERSNKTIKKEKMLREDYENNLNVALELSKDSELEISRLRNIIKEIEHKKPKSEITLKKNSEMFCKKYTDEEKKLLETFKGINLSLWQMALHELSSLRRWMPKREALLREREEKIMSSLGAMKHINSNEVDKSPTRNRPISVVSASRKQKKDLMSSEGYPSYERAVMTANMHNQRVPRGLRSGIVSAAIKD